MFRMKNLLLPMGLIACMVPTISFAADCQLTPGISDIDQFGLLRACAVGVVAACLFGFGTRFWFNYSQKEPDFLHWLLEAVVAAGVAALCLHLLGIPETFWYMVATGVVCLGSSVLTKLPRFNCVWRQSIFTMVGLLAATAALAPLTALALFMASVVSAAYWTHNRDLNGGTVLFAFILALLGARSVMMFQIDLTWAIIPAGVGFLIERGLLFYCARMTSPRKPNVELFKMTAFGLGLCVPLALILPASWPFLLAAAAPMAFIGAWQSYYARTASTTFFWQ